MQNGENLATTKRGRRFHTKPLPASRADLPLLKWQPRTKLKGKQVKQRNMIHFAKIHPTMRKSKRPSAAKRIFAQEYEASASYQLYLEFLNRPDRRASSSSVSCAAQDFRSFNSAASEAASPNPCVNWCRVRNTIPIQFLLTSIACIEFIRFEILQIFHSSFAI